MIELKFASIIQHPHRSMHHPFFLPLPVLISPPEFQQNTTDSVNAESLQEIIGQVPQQYAEKQMGI